jgi:4-hydroxyphenylpyruvate dioxygenase
MSVASHSLKREAQLQAANPLSLAGIEFIEFATSRPQALGQLLEQMGFRPVARHRSREVMRYVQGDMNIIVNAHGLEGIDTAPQLTAIALRVQDAGAAWQRIVNLGAWPVPAQVQPMELLIPGVHGVGNSRIYLVDRWREFSIYDVDFIPIPNLSTVTSTVPSTAGLHWFGVVQYVGAQRIADWCEFYGTLFGFTPVPDDQRYGILPKGRVLASPCGTFYLQLIEPEQGASEPQDEQLQRIAFGTPNVPTTVKALRERGVEFINAQSLQPDTRGALTAEKLNGVMFELVHHS